MRIVIRCDLRKVYSLIAAVETEEENKQLIEMI